MTSQTYDTRSHVTYEDGSISCTFCNVATSECITSSEKMLSRFDELTNKPLSVKDMQLSRISI